MMARILVLPFALVGARRIQGYTDLLEVNGQLLPVCPTHQNHCKGPSTLATLFNHMWPRIVAGIFIPVGNHYFQALASTLQFVAQVCDRLWLVPATDRAFAYITYMSP